MQINTAIIVALLASPVLVEIVRWLKEIFSEKKLNKAVVAMLRDRILHLCEKYIELGNIPHKQWESLYCLYKNYKALGGNGFIDEEIDTVKRLPRVNKGIKYN